MEALTMAGNIVFLAMLSTYSQEAVNCYPQISQQVVDSAHWAVWPANCEAQLWRAC